MEKFSVPTLKLDSGYQIPVIGFGTYLMKGSECYESVKTALEVGYTHIDTASIYRNQEQIGRLLKEAKIDRKSIFITSKVSPGEQGYKEAKQSCENILQRLGTSYLDLLIIHWPGVSKIEVKSPKNSLIRRQTWRALVELQKQGKVRDIGVSNYLKHHLEDLMKHSEVKPAINQFEIHPLLWEKETIDFCREHKIVIEAYSPLARADDKLFKNKTIISLAEKYHKSVAQICLRWALQQDFIVLPKSKHKNRIVQNFHIFDFKLSQLDMQSITELTKMNVRTCWDPNAIIH